MKKVSLIILLLAAAFSFSQNEERSFKTAVFQDGEFLKVEVSDGFYQIKVYSKEIVETTFVPLNETFKQGSHAVVLKPEYADARYSTDAKNIYLKTEGISVTIKKKPFQISYEYKGKPIISEKKGYVKNDSLETIQFNLKQDEVLYGGGARALGMNRRGNRLELYNKAHYGYETRSELMNFTLPIVLSSNQYMLHFDNAPIGFCLLYTSPSPRD